MTKTLALISPILWMTIFFSPYLCANTFDDAQDNKLNPFEILNNSKINQKENEIELAEAKGGTTKKSSVIKKDDRLPPFGEGLRYDELRMKLINLGWIPKPQAGEEAFMPGCGDVKDRGWTEIEGCSGTGLGYRKFVFENNKNDLLYVVTVGGSDQLFKTYELIIKNKNSPNKSRDRTDHINANEQRKEFKDGLCYGYLTSEISSFGIESLDEEQSNYIKKNAATFSTVYKIMDDLKLKHFFPCYPGYSDRECYENYTEDTQLLMLGVNVGMISYRDYYHRERFGLICRNSK